MILGVFAILIIFLIVFWCSAPTDSIDKPKRLPPKCNLPKDIKGKYK